MPNLICDLSSTHFNFIKPGFYKSSFNMVLYDKDKTFNLSYTLFHLILTVQMIYFISFDQYISYIFVTFSTLLHVKCF